MAAQPQHTLATANAPTTHGALLSASPSSTRAASPRLAHYTGGRLSSSSSVIGVGGGGSGGGGVVGSSGSGSGGGGVGCGYGRGICASTHSLVSNTSSTSTTPHNHYQTPRPASRRVRPCSLCGTTALRPQPTFLTSSPVGPLEQPIVLLHRLEDGLPQGDVKSLHAYGTIRLLPVQSPQDHDVCEYESESDTSDGGDVGRVEMAKNGHIVEGCKRGNISPWGSNSGSHDDDSEDYEEQCHGKEPELEMKSILFEDSCSLEDIIDGEVSVNPSNGDQGCLKIFRPSVIQHSLHNSESEHESLNESLIGEIVFGNDQTDSDSDKDLVMTNDSNQRSQNKVSKGQDSNSKIDRTDQSIDSENKLSAVLHCSSPILDTNHSSDYTPGSPSKHASSSVVTPVSSTATVSQASLSSTCPSTHSNCTQPSVLPQAVTSHSPNMLHDHHHHHHTITKAKCPSSSPNLPDHSVVYSPTARHSPMSLSLSTESPIFPVPSPPVSVPSPSLVTSPPSSPPSPCESSSPLFSPPPSPSLDVTDLDCTKLEEKGDLQTQPSSPYSPGTSPASPASLVSQSDSPPSPSPNVSAESPKNSPDPMYPKLDEQMNSNEAGSNLEVMPSQPLTEINTVIAPQHTLTPSLNNQVDSSLKTQVECSLDINDTSAHTQVELRGSSECNGPLRLGDSMAYDDSEKKTKPSLDHCASSIVESVNVEPDSTPMKIRFRIRPKINKSFVQKQKRNEHSKNGIPKIVLTLKGDGPNKEYSCSNRLRNEDQSFSGSNVVSRKHKSKKDKREKERYKVKKSLKGSRYKRHLELFGEDSNDSQELRREKERGINGKGEDILRGPDTIQDRANTPLAFPKLGESPDVSDDDLFLPVKALSYNFSESINKVCEKVKCGSPDQGDILDGSFSDSLPDLEPVHDPEDAGKPGRDGDSQVRSPMKMLMKKCVKLQKRKPTRGMLTKRKILRSLNHKRALPIRRRPRRVGFGLRKEGQSCLISETAVKLEKADEGHDFNGEQRNNSTRDELNKNITECEQNLETEVERKEEKCSELSSSTSTSESKENSLENSSSSQDTTVMFKEIPSKAEKQLASKNTISNLRVRRDRNCKVPESVTDSNECLWVSFGVDAPIRVPTSDVPSLRADSKVRDKNSKSRKNAEESSGKGNDFSCKKNTDKTKETNTNTVDHLIEEAAKQLVQEYSDKKEKSSEKVIILPNKEAENWRPIKPQANARVHGEQAARDLADEHTANISKRLNGSPKRSIKSIDEESHGRRSSLEASEGRESEDKPMLKNCINSSSSDVETSSETSAKIDARKGNASDSSLTDECTKMSAAELMNDDQYYRPKKIQKVLNENLLNVSKHPRNESMTTPDKVPYSDTVSEDRTSDLESCEPTKMNSDSAIETNESEAYEVSVNNAKANDREKEKEEAEVKNIDTECSAPVPPHDPECSAPVPPHDPEFEKVWGGSRVRKRGRRKKQAAKSPASPCKQQDAQPQQEDAASNAEASLPAKENVEVKRDKEGKKGIRRTRKKYENGSGSGKSSAYKEIQQRIEFQHEQERGRRLAQEIKGFNWLEQKIKNSSLNPPTSSTSAAPASKKLPVILPKTLSRTLSLPATSLATTSLIQPNSFPVASKRDESDVRRNSYTGCISSISSISSSGLRGHLQTAVPPLLPSSRVTALPKRRASPPSSLIQSPTSSGLIAAITVPSSSPGALHGSININPNMGVVYGPVQSSGPTTYSLADVSAASLYSNSECDRATLYSSTDTNKATLYGVPNPRLEVLFEDTHASSGNLYGDAVGTTTRGVPLQVQHSPSDMNSRPCSLTALPASTTRHEDWKDPKKGYNETVLNSSSVSSQVSSEDSSSGSHLQGSSGPAIGVRFSHKQALLKRAFSDMLKFESSTLPAPAQGDQNLADKEESLQDAPSKDDCSLIIDVDAQSKIAESADVEEEPQPNSNSSEPSDDKSMPEGTSHRAKSDSPDSGNAKSVATESQLQSSSEENKTSDINSEEKLASPDPIKEIYMRCMSGVKDEVVGMDSAQLLSMLFEELQRTKEEVERLRKRQDLFLTEKSEKKDGEQEEKEEKPPVKRECSESPKIPTIPQNEEKSGTSVEKTARISIRNDLIASENEVAPETHVLPPSGMASVITSVKCAVNARASAMTEKPLISPLPKTSPSIPQTSPASCRASPCSTRASPLAHTSPILNPLLGSPAAAQHDVSVIHTSIAPPVTSPSSSKCTISSPYSAPVVTSHGIPAPRASPVLPRSSPVITRNSPGVSGSPSISKTSPGLNCTSPAAQSPGMAMDKNLIELMPSKLRTAFGINKEVEVMAVTVGSRPPLAEPPPQTFLQVVGNQHSVQDAQLLLNAVRSRTHDIISNSDRERNQLQNSVPFSQRSPHEAVKRSLPALSAETDIKRARMSTSDLPEFPPISRKPPPPLKPVASIQRRYSDGSESRKVEPIMVHLPHANIHALSNLPNEPNSASSIYPYGQPRSSPTQHQPGRRSNESSMDRNMEYQQALGVQHAQFQQHLVSSPPMMRSLGPDKATIIPIPAPPKPSNIPPHYVKQFGPPSSRGSVMEHHQTARLEQSMATQDYSRTSLAYFHKMKQSVQQNCDAALSVAERSVGKEGLRVSSGHYEKTLQPQTFAPRVLVRESIPETSLQMPPPPPFANPHFPDCNPRVPNVPGHHFLNNLHHNANPSMHHMVTSGLLHSGLQGSSTTLTTSKSNPRNASGSSTEKKQCLGCPQQARFLCSGCKKAWYCSENCQRTHWAIHNTSCIP